MKTKAFVLATPDGMFIRTSRMQTHVGWRLEAYPCSNIEHATTFHYTSLDREHRTALKDLADKVRFVPVTVERTVTLDGYGVAK